MQPDPGAQAVQRDVAGETCAHGGVRLEAVDGDARADRRPGQSIDTDVGADIEHACAGGDQVQAELENPPAMLERSALHLRGLEYLGFDRGRVAVAVEEYRRGNAH